MLFQADESIKINRY